MILMATNTFYLDILPVQPETGVVVEADRAETAFSFDFVCNGSVLLYLGFDFIKNRGFVTVIGRLAIPSRKALTESF